MAQERRVLQVFQPEEGGVPEHVTRLAGGLARRGFVVEAAGPAGTPFGRELAEAGVELHRLPLEAYPRPRDLLVGPKLRQLDRERRYVLVHAHSSVAGVLVRSALPRRRRLVYTPHCFAFEAGFGRTTRAGYRALEQVLLARSGAIVAASEWERSRALASLHGAGRRVRLIRHGVPPCTDAAPEPALRSFAAGGKLAGFVSRLEPQKDPVALVRAAAALEREGRLAGRVAIVGNGRLHADVEREIARLGVGDKVRLFPFEPPATPYLRALDLLVLPSLWESFPLAPLEALACGVPVLATRVGGLPEAVEEGISGRLVPPADEGALTAALAELLAAPDRLDEMGARGRAIAAERFGVERMVIQTVALYEELLEGLQ
jgi:glycosyltransferase involved in cell wall biosynthesis